MVNRCFWPPEKFFPPSKIGVSSPSGRFSTNSLSALDYQTDLNLRQALQKLDCTTIIISQRIRSIQEAKQILVLDNGSLVGCDSHENLLANCPTYQEIYHAQQEEKYETA